LGTPAKKLCCEDWNAIKFSFSREAHPMIFTIVISGFVFGCVLGLRFRVFVLGPALVVAAISTAAISSANGFGGGRIVLAVLAVVVSLQCGYVVGLGVSYITERTRLPIRAWTPYRITEFDGRR
jgi:hypothetical protein